MSFNCVIFNAANSVYMTDMPPPYPGINGYSGYATAPQSGANGFTQPPVPPGQFNHLTYNSFCESTVKYIFSWLSN